MNIGSILLVSCALELVGCSGNAPHSPDMSAASRDCDDRYDKPNHYHTGEQGRQTGVVAACECGLGIGAHLGKCCMQRRFGLFLEQCRIDACLDRALGLLQDIADALVGRRERSRLRQGRETRPGTGSGLPTCT